MTKKLSFCLLFLSVCLLPLSGQTTTKLLFSLANLKNDSLSRAGIFIQKSETELYLVTSAQVARNMDRNVFINMQDSAGNLPVQFKILDFANPVQWIYHPFADLAVLKLNPRPYFFNKYLQHRFISFSLLDSSLIDIPKDSSLIVVGYLTGWEIKNSKPVTYISRTLTGFINLEVEDDKNRQSIVILQDIGVRNFAGGPVFLAKTEANDASPARMLGFIMHGDISDNAGRAITVMTPAAYIYDLIK